MLMLMTGGVFFTKISSILLATVDAVDKALSIKKNVK